VGDGWVDITNAGVSTEGCLKAKSLSPMWLAPCDRVGMDSIGGNVAKSAWLSDSILGAAITVFSLNDKVTTDFITCRGV